MPFSFANSTAVAFSTLAPASASSCVSSYDNVGIRLASGEADRIAAQIANRHRQERHRNAFASSQQHVEFTAFGIRRDLLRKRQQFVRRVTHRRHDDDNVVTGLL